MTDDRPPRTGYTCPLCQRVIVVPSDHDPSCG